MQTFILVVATMFAIISLLLYSRSSKEANLPYYLLLLSFALMYFAMPTTEQWRQLVEIKTELALCEIKKQNCTIEIRTIVNADTTRQ